MKKKTQKEKVAELLKAKGFIDNIPDCVNTGLTLRLSNKIRELEADGWVFDEAKSGYFPTGSKNWRYYLVSEAKPPVKPKQVITQLPDGSVRVEYVVA